METYYSSTTSDEAKTELEKEVMKALTQHRRDDADLYATPDLHETLDRLSERGGNDAILRMYTWFVLQPEEIDARFVSA